MVVENSMNNPVLNDKVEHIDLLEAIIRDICEK